MPKPNKTVVFSLGGSLVHPDEINVSYLKKFKELILEFTKKGNTAIIVVGGGKVARRYNEAARKLNPDVSSYELDWMGIKSTKANAELARIMFNSKAYYKVLDDPTKIPSKEIKKIYIAGGWKPGASSDHVAVHLAKTFNAGSVINLTNIDYVYDKDPNKFKDAKKLELVSWKQFRKIVGNTWDPGANLPFDPIASKLADKEGIEVAILNGEKLGNLKNYLYGKSYKGTIISN